MKKFNIEYLCKAVQGELLNEEPQTEICGVSIDSRTIEPGQVFFALQGDQHDGHQFVRQALRRGAAIAVVAKVSEDYAGDPLILVNDTVQALQQFARAYRGEFKIPLAAITGSVGKTTTKEILAQCLESFFTTLKTPGNFNNDIGLPMTLLSLEENHQMGVVELGMRAPDEIRRLAEIALPTIAVITNVEPVHLETMVSLERIAQAKCEILSVLSDDNFAVINGDNEILLAEANKYDCIKYTFGYNESCDFQVKQVKVSSEAIEIKVDLMGREEIFYFPLPAASLALNVVAAAAVCFILGLDMSSVKAALKKYRPTGNRLKIMDLKNGGVVINDTYNANPLSVFTALEVGMNLRYKGKFIAVLGDMLELGSFEKEGHQSVGQKAVETGVDLLITVGERARMIAEGAQSAGMAAEKINCFSDQAAAIEFIKQVRKSDDTILFKASRSMELDKMIEKLDL